MIPNFSFLAPLLTLSRAKVLKRNFNEDCYRDFPEVTSSVQIPGSMSLGDINTNPLFNYEIFPKNILIPYKEWFENGRGIAIGDTIIQRVFIPPIGFGFGFGFCLEFAVRVRDVFNTRDKVGFSYETLVGHPECGISEFYFSENGGSVRFVIHTWSKPGHWISRAFKDIFTLPYQRWCTQKALENVAKFYRDSR